MKHVLKFKWPITALMLIAAVVSFIVSPNLTQLAAEKGDVQLPDNMPSEAAAQFLESHDQDVEMMSIVLEFDENPAEHQEDIETYISELEGLDYADNVINPFTFDDEMQESFINTDTGVIMIPMEYVGDLQEILANSEEVESLNNTAGDISVTSNEMIQKTLEEDAMNGVRTTEVFTIAIIVIVLLVMFRSVVTPFIPLIAVGIAYLLGQSFVGWFVEWFGFPISPQTQSFLIVILFGIGTDYVILLLNRFKEELEHHDKHQAVINTFKTAGKTVFISGISGAILFGVLFFANFEIYRSAVGVAIGILALLLSLFTVLPTLMAVLGKYIFWPSKQTSGSGESKIWTPLGMLSLKYPTRVIFSVLAVLAVLIYFHDDSVHYDSLAELDDSYSAVHAVNVIGDSFDAGSTFPVEVIFNNGEDLVTEDGLSRLDSVAEAASKVEGVKEVQTLTRPLGDKMDELTVSYQLGEANSGLTEIQDGLTEMSTSLSDINEQLSNSDTASGDLSEIETGVNDISDGIDGVSQYLTATGDTAGAAEQLQQLSAGADQLSSGVSQANSQMQTMTEEASAQMEELAAGLSEMSSGIDEINEGLTGVSDLMTSIEDNEAVDETGINVPSEVLENSEFESAIEQYSFADGQAVKMNVVLDVDPYSNEAIEVLDEIEESVNNELSRLDRQDTDAYFSGVTSMNRDLDTLTSDDYTNVVIMFIVTLFVILTVLFRSLVLPVVMIGSIFMTYFASMTISQWILSMFGIDQLNWAVPFFSLIIFVALGIDYSIFIIDRFKEEVRYRTIRDAIETSIRRMGTVVITAVIILTGTFAALYPSGIAILVQVTSIIIFALLFYAFIVLPLLVPALIVTLKRGNWWPLRMPGGKAREDRFEDK
ncbi:Putative membrane protein YdgH [Jeotgalicoccus aerolatus]|uniref:RND superfamily putative drug exporter n=1 Tax=Jeotgalicoccus aerolatus TaxID=709510 RepID=A0ABS4HMJ9_9STAP|nr:MMPL family transporter [Jeotgalicoccus aerolatus]MBP1952151.1 RND superfamily putative drug exporter [Jeotgalicoccus aerolatus]GGE06284.1 putative membrane protein YdgH [Jeotgalicoccus aerolatus]CAD2070807.1 Putative membrane protein YdgH [Jeotgalicoccus aerolatus]